MKAADAGDRRLQQRAADVVADGVRDPPQGSLDSLGVLGPLRSRRSRSTHRGPPATMKMLRIRIVNAGEDRVDDADPDVAEGAGGVGDLLGQLLRLLLELAGDVVVVVEVVERLVLLDVVLDVLDVLRRVVGEVLGLARRAAGSAARRGRPGSG